MPTFPTPICSTYPLVVMLEFAIAKKEIYGLSLPNGEKMLAKLFVDDSLLFLKVEPGNLRKVHEIVQLFASPLGSQCNIEKSRPISLTKGDGFFYVGWIGEVVSRGTIFQHLGAPRGCYMTPKQVFD